VVCHGTDAYALIVGTVDERVRKAVQGKQPSIAGCARAKRRIRRHEPCGPGELEQKRDGD
jgi:hypothetical protein